MLRRALLVDPNSSRLDLLAREIDAGVVGVTACTDFAAARRSLLDASPDFLVSRLRLGPFNGLHLVHLAVHARLHTRCLVYDEPVDPHLAFEARQIGAFFEATSRVRFALPAFLQSALPERDRRDARRHDQRALFRGGRRASDLGAIRPAGSPSILFH